MKNTTATTDTQNTNETVTFNPNSLFNLTGETTENGKKIEWSFISTRGKLPMKAKKIWGKGKELNSDEMGYGYACELLTLKDILALMKDLSVNGNKVENIKVIEIELPLEEDFGVPIDFFDLPIAKGRDDGKYAVYGDYIEEPTFGSPEYVYTHPTKPQHTFPEFEYIEPTNLINDAAEQLAKHYGLSFTDARGAMEQAIKEVETLPKYDYYRDCATNKVAFKEVVLYARDLLTVPF